MRRSRLINLLQGISFEDEYNLVVGSLDLDPNSFVVDVACGTGIYARSIARGLPSTTVLGIDVSVPMLTQAVNLRRLEQVANVHYVRADGSALPLLRGIFRESGRDTASCHRYGSIPTRRIGIYSAPPGFLEHRESSRKRDLDDLQRR